MLKPASTAFQFSIFRFSFNTVFFMDQWRVDNCRISGIFYWKIRSVVYLKAVNVKKQTGSSLHTMKKMNSSFFFKQATQICSVCYWETLITVLLKNELPRECLIVLSFITLNGVKINATRHFICVGVW